MISRIDSRFALRLSITIIKHLSRNLVHKNNNTIKKYQRVTLLIQNKRFSIMAQTTMRQATELNNLGAELFAAGEPGRALEVFRNALSFIPAHGTFDDRDAITRQVASATSTSLGITFRQGPRVSEKATGLSFDPASQPFCYRKPLIFTRVLPETQGGTAAFCATVVFNMALSFDYRFRKSGNKTFCSKSLQLYESSIDLFCKASKASDMSSVIAAAINNKARIYFEHCNYHTVTFELERLQRFMVMADQSANMNDILEEDDFQGILLNILLLRPPAVAQAA